MEQNKVIKILVDGTTTIVNAPAARLGLTWLQEQVGGYIEVMRMNGSHILVFDEEGLLKDLPRNKRIPCLVGTALVCRQVGSEMLGFTQKEADAVVAEMDAARRASRAGLN